MNNHSIQYFYLNLFAGCQANIWKQLIDKLHDSIVLYKLQKQCNPNSSNLKQSNYNQDILHSLTMKNLVHITKNSLRFGFNFALKDQLNLLYFFCFFGQQSGKSRYIFQQIQPFICGGISKLIIFLFYYPFDFHPHLFTFKKTLNCLKQDSFIFLKIYKHVFQHSKVQIFSNFIQGLIYFGGFDFGNQYINTQQKWTFLIIAQKFFLASTVVFFELNSNFFFQKLSQSLKNYEKIKEFNILNNELVNFGKESIKLMPRSIGKILMLLFYDKFSQLIRNNSLYKN